MYEPDPVPWIVSPFAFTWSIRVRSTGAVTDATVIVTLFRLSPDRAEVLMQLTAFTPLSQTIWELEKSQEPASFTYSAAFAFPFTCASTRMLEARLLFTTITPYQFGSSICSPMKVCGPRGVLIASAPGARVSLAVLMFVFLYLFRPPRMFLHPCR